MQQTTKYQLNLIEMDDVFSPDALNESTQKVESALAAEETARKAVDAQLTGRADGLAQRVTALEAKKIAFGSYIGKATSAGQSQFISLDFTPAAVIVGNEIALQNQPSLDISIGKNGFTAMAKTYSTLNQNNTEYHYIAFG